MQEHLTTAATMYREMDMPYWLGQAEVEMGGLADGHRAPIQPPSVYDQDPRFQL